MIRLFSRIILLTMSIVVLFVSCESDNSVGVTVRPQDDIIIQAIDTFHLETSDVYDVHTSAQADSMFLGEFYSPVFGTTKADLLVQVAPPEKYTFPPAENNPQPDSLILIMYYRSWYGASNTPLEISVYEMNKQIIEYEKQYLSTLNPDDFTDYSVLMGKKLTTSVDLSVPDSVAGQEGFVPSVRYKFDTAQLNRFYDIAKSPYASTEEFLQAFNGMYITTKYGASTVLNLFQIDMRLHYHYTYKKNGKDTVVNTSIIYPANREVRQLNAFSHKDLKEVVQQNDSLNFIKASGGIYTKAELPIGRMCSRIKDTIGDKELHISGATLQVEVAELEENDLDLTPPQYLLVITEDEYEDFLKTYDVPTIVDTNMVIGYYSPTAKAYNIDIAYYLTKHLRALYDTDDINEKLNLLLVPVELEQVVDQNSVTSVTKIRPQTRVGGVRIRSGKNTYSPMRLKMLYAGF